VNSNKLKLIVESMSDAMHRIQSLGPPYIYSGRDPVHGIDCSGFAVCVLNEAGFRFPTLGDLSSYNFRNEIYTLDHPDPELQDQGELLKALFLKKDSTGEYTHIALANRGALVMEATLRPLNILMFSGIYQMTNIAKGIVDYVDEKEWGGTGVPQTQDLLQRVAPTTNLNFSSQTGWLDDFFEGIANLPEAWTDLDDLESDPVYMEGGVGINQNLEEELRIRAWMEDGYIPDHVKVEGDEWPYIRSFIQYMLGRTRMTEIIVQKMYRLEADRALGGSCIRTTTANKWIGYYSNLNGYTVETGYMPAKWVRYFDVPNKFVVQGSGAIDHE
jgi:hypothetical protein